MVPWQRAHRRWAVTHPTNTTEGGGHAALEAQKAELIDAILDLDDGDTGIVLAFCKALLRRDESAPFDVWLRDTMVRLADLGGAA